MTLPYELHTDASSTGLGAVLYQKQDGMNRVIGYASRGLTLAERNYPAHKLEFLALKWFITEKFKDYLYGTKFTVLTDNNPLAYVLSHTKLDATGHRWVAAQSSYDFDIKYRPGRNNAEADALSRLPTVSDLTTISSDSIKAISKSQISPYIETISMSEQPLSALKDISTRSEIDIRKAQHEDCELFPWIQSVHDQYKPKKTDLSGSFADGVMLRNFDRLKLIDNILYREVTVDERKVNQLVVPSSLVEFVLKSVHNSMGHPGRERTLSVLRDRFFWPGQYRDVDNWIKECRRCILRKTPAQDRAELINIQTTQPLDLVCMDFLSFERSKGGYENVLVITNHFTRYAIAVPTKNSTARTTAEAFF
jgi:hypothetical protein